MLRSGKLIVALLALAMMASGCQTRKPPAATSTASEAQDDSKIAQALEKLSAEDRPLAKAQGYCAVTSEPLGSMGPPVKLLVNEQPVFICCKGCEKKAKSNPDKTLAKVEELKTKVKSESSH